MFSKRPREQNPGFSHFSLKILIKEQEKFCTTLIFYFVAMKRVELKANLLEILQITSVITGGKDFLKRRDFLNHL